MRLALVLLLLAACSSSSSTGGTGGTTPLTPSQLCKAASDRFVKCGGAAFSDADMTACQTGVGADANHRRYWECLIDLSCSNQPASCASGSGACATIKCDTGKSCVNGVPACG